MKEIKVINFDQVSVVVNDSWQLSFLRIKILFLKST